MANAEPSGEPPGHNTIRIHLDLPHSGAIGFKSTIDRFLEASIVDLQGETKRSVGLYLGASTSPVNGHLALNAHISASKECFDIACHNVRQAMEQFCKLYGIPTDIVHITTFKA